jgi:hypothetical protein
MPAIRMVATLPEPRGAHDPDRPRLHSALTYERQNEGERLERMNAKMTAQERQAEVRRSKLALVQEQVAAGELVIRQMTKAEQAAWAARRARLTPSELAARAEAAASRRRRQGRAA